MGRYLLAVFLVILFLGANQFMAYRASTMEERIDQYDTIVLGQAAVQPGAPQAIRVVARHVGTDKPRPDEAVKVYIAPKDKPREKKLMFEGKTNTEGSSAPKFVAPEEEGTYTLIIESGTDTHEATLTVKRKAKVLLSTDKPLYQPGQLVHVRALALSSIDAKPLAATNATFEMEDPKGNKVFRKVITTSEYGIASVSIALAPELILGRYRVTVIANGVESHKSIRVERYVLPKFRVALETDRSFYKPNDKLEGTITARYFFGKPVSKGEAEVVFYTVDVGERELHSWKGTTDEMGRVEFTYTLPAAFHGTELEKGSALLFLNVSVTDRGDHAEQIVRQFPISTSDIVIDLIPESGHLNFNFLNVMYVATSTPDGVPVPATVEVDGDVDFTTTIKTGDLGLGSFMFRPQSNNPQLILEAKDAEGRTGGKNWFYREGRERRDYELEQSTILVRTDRGVYRVGDTATVTVLHSGAAPAAYVDMVKEGQTVDARSLTLKSGQGEAVFDIDASMAGQLIVHAYHTTRSTAVERATRRILVLPADQLAVSIGTDRESYKPGELARLSVATERKGEGVPAAVGLTIVDESVFALEEAKAGFERMAFYLGRELAKPRFTVYGFNPMAAERPKPAPDTVNVKEDIQIAEQVFLARNAPEAKLGQFGIKVSTREEKEAQVREAKRSFYRNQALLLSLICLLAGLASIAAFVRGTEEGWWAAIKDLVKGVFLVGLVFGSLVAFVYMLEWVDDGIDDISYRDRGGPQGVLLLTFFLLSVTLWRLQHVKAAGFHARFIAGIFFPIAVLGVMAAGTMVRSPTVIISCVAVLGA
ncbi:MAG: MG2 domain-containing protein, partial [Methanopyri archaeon]|nr:MG2 domain-containing protein [Methanopyri archaeon]